MSPPSLPPSLPPPSLSQCLPLSCPSLLPSLPQIDEYEQLGAYALIGLPEALYSTRFVDPGKTKSEYPIIIGGDNFGCGSSREVPPSLPSSLPPSLPPPRPLERKKPLHDMG